MRAIRDRVESDADSDGDDSFSVESAAGGVNLDALAREYVADKIRGEGRFEDSTDSDSSALDEEEEPVEGKEEPRGKSAEEEEEEAPKVD